MFAKRGPTKKCKFLLKGEFTNFDNVRLNNAPQYILAAPRIAKHLESLDMSNRFFRRRRSPSKPLSGDIFTPTSKCILQIIFFSHKNAIYE